MWFHSWINSLQSSNPIRRSRRKAQSSDRRRPAARRLFLEGLEERRLLTFVPAVDYSVGVAPQSIVAADFNNDGQLDLATANIGDNSVSLLLGDGQGGFAAESRLSVGAIPLSVAVGDFDSDGNLDLATATPYAVRVMPGDGAGSFGAPAIMGVVGNPDSVAVGDFNGDGKLDLGVTSNAYYSGYPYSYYGYYQGYVNVLLGNGGGTFSAAKFTYLGPGYHITSLAADLNGDLNDDFVTFNYDYGTGSVLLGDGSGYLQRPTSSLYTGDNSYAVAAGDLDTDGDNDLVISNYNRNSVGVFLGDGSGGFSSAGTYSAGTLSTSIVLADLNQDGHLDVVTTNYYHEVHILYGEGDGAFSTPTLAAVGFNPWAIAAGDFNGDTWPDIAITNYSEDTASVLINDGIWPDRRAQWLRIDDMTVTEGHTGTVAAEFMVTLSAPSDQPVTVQYETADGSATAGSDYQSALGTLIIPAGQTTGTITVLVNGDRLGEANETFFVFISSTNVTITDAQAAATIRDDEPLVTITDATVTEGHAGTVAADFTVTLSAPSDEPVTVQYGTVNGTATAGSDYQSATGTLIIPAGQTTGTITVLVNGDRLGEANETFFVIIGSTNATITDGQAAATILDDEPLITITDVTVAEGDTGTVAAVFTVTRSGSDLASTSTVNYSTANGTALAGSDFQTASGTLTFAPGQTSQTIAVAVLGDQMFEPDETFAVRLSGATNATIGDGNGTGTIANDDTYVPPSISISDVSKVEGRNGNTMFVFTVSLSAPSATQVTVRYATADGTARAGEDYMAASGTLMFAPGETTKTITIKVKGDSKKEASETFDLDLFDLSSNASFSKSRGLGTILNDD